MDLFFEPNNMLFDLSADGRGSRVMTILLGRQHRDQLPSTRTDRVQLLSGLIRNGTEFRADLVGELGQNMGINAVGFGQAADGSSEITGLTRIDRNSGQTGCQKT